MFERMVLPLDGSQLAEVALPYAEELAGRIGSEVILLHACPPEQQALHRMHELYIESVGNMMQREVKRKFPRCKECIVRPEALIGEPAEVILNYVPKNSVNLIVLATHGASGLKVWMLGSVVDKVVRAVDIPVLLIRAKEGQKAEGKRQLIKRIILPLDGSAASEIAIPYAVELANKMKATILLFQMARRSYAYYPVEGFTNIDWAKADSAAEKYARSYIISMEKKLREQGIPVTHEVSLGADAAAEILELEKSSKADLVVMATRGRSPIARWAFGSVAEKVLREGDLPLLLVREADNK